MKKFNNLNNQNTTSGQIQFTANNQKGIANGAVYTVTTYVKKVRLQASVTDHTQVDTVCEKTSDFHSKWVEHTKVLKELYSDLNTNNVDVMADTGYYPKTSFQILSVLCNKEGAKTITNTIISKAKDSNGIEQGTKYYIVNRNSGLVADVDTIILVTKPTLFNKLRIRILKQINNGFQFPVTTITNLNLLILVMLLTFTQ